MNKNNIEVRDTHYERGEFFKSTLEEINKNNDCVWWRKRTYTYSYGFIIFLIGTICLVLLTWYNHEISIPSITS